MPPRLSDLPGNHALALLEEAVRPAIRHRTIRVSDVNVFVREVVLLDTGHFALGEEADTIATAVDAFHAKPLD